MMIFLLTILLVLFCLVGAGIAFLLLERNSVKDEGIKAGDEMSVENRWSLVELGPDSFYPLQRGNEDADERR